MAVSGPGAIEPAPTGVPVALAQWGGSWGRNAVEGGRSRLFCFALQRRRSRRRKKAGTGRCGWAIETRSSPGHAQSIETAWGATVTQTGRSPNGPFIAGVQGVRRPRQHRRPCSALSAPILPGPFRQRLQPRHAAPPRIARVGDGCATNDLRDRQSRHLRQRHPSSFKPPHSVVPAPRRDRLTLEIGSQPSQAAPQANPLPRGGRSASWRARLAARTTRTGCGAGPVGRNFAGKRGGDGCAGSRSQAPF